MGNTKDKLEQAAKECADSFLLTDFYMGSDIKDAIMEAFEAGANWQKEQSPWISVEDRLPNNQNLVLVRSEYSGKAMAYYYGKNCGFIAHGEGACKDFGDITHWMHIPE